ncbi:MAG: site-specific integrase, partial [Alphaproteobacteria bacterium]
MHEQYKNFQQTIDANVADCIQKWHNNLVLERRLSLLTGEAYLMDMKEFMSFLFDYQNAPVTLKTLKNMTISDFRAFLVHRATQKSSRASTARCLSALRNFFKFLARQSILENQAIMSVRSPHPPKVLPKPLAVDEAQRFLAAADHFAREPWQGARDKALYMLLYGCGLRIAEALSLNIQDFPKTGDAFTITGKGNKQRLVPLLPVVKKAVTTYLRIHPNPIETAPLFVGS